MMNRQQQQGSTLVIVLIVLILITIIGTIALRNSLLDLRLSTSNQIGNLLIESNDATLLSMENPKLANERLLANGMYGYFLTSGNEDDEMTFCVNSQSNDFFTLSRASVIGSTKLGTQGYCRENVFATGRSAVMTQVYIRKLADKSVAFSQAIKGTGLGSGNIFNQKSNTMAVTVISILPTITAISSSQLQTCFRKTATTTTTDTVTQCFRDANVPYNVQYAEYNVGNS